MVKIRPNALFGVVFSEEFERGASELLDYLNGVGFFELGDELQSFNRNRQQLNWAVFSQPANILDYSFGLEF